MENTNQPGSDAPVKDREAGKFRASISDEHFNFNEVEIADRKVTGAQIAEAGGAHPVTDFVILQHLKSGELETLRPTETTDLAENGIERFFVIKGSETFRFIVEGLSMEWPRPNILGKHVKILARLEPDSVLVLDQTDGDRVIEDDDKVELNAPGVEELRIRKKPCLLTVIYNQEQEFKLDRRIYTTEELMQIFGVLEGYKLDILEKHGLRELKPGEKIHIRDGMEFASHPPVGQSS